MYKYFTCAAILVASFGFAASASAEADMGDLVKCPDYSSVYYVGEDGGRYTFPNENTYMTWYDDFDDVVTISCDDLATLPLEDVVPYQAGTQLLKTQSIPTVYAVEPDGILRSLESEEQAEDLYGEDWAGQIDDIPDGFFTKYDIGQPLAEDELPEGYLLKDEDELYRVDDQGQVEQFDFVLDEDQKGFYDDYANDLDTVQSELDTEFTILKEGVLALLGDYETNVLELMKTVSVSEEEKVDSLDNALEEMSPELVELLTQLNLLQDNAADLEEEGKDWDDDIMRVKDFLSDVQLKLDEAVELLHTEEWYGKDIDEAEEMADNALDLLDQAWTILPDGDYQTAEEYGTEALAAAEKIMAGQGIVAEDHSDWSSDHLDQMCTDCWWDDSSYDDAVYWDKDESWVAEEYVESYVQDWKTSWESANTIVDDKTTTDASKDIKTTE